MLEPGTARFLWLLPQDPVRAEPSSFFSLSPWGSPAVALVLSRIAGLGFTRTLVLSGAGLSRATLKAVGWRPLAQGVALWLFISAASFLVIVERG
jgi:hypothetical protein